MCGSGRLSRNETSSGNGGMDTSWGKRGADNRCQPGVGNTATFGILALHRGSQHTHYPWATGHVTGI
ncbi:hypothetical protein GCM10028785_06980 [Hydrogenophaga soli]